jgi:Zn-dependent M28 family amino/carboxypeptidase
LAIGARNIWHYEKLIAASDYIEATLRGLGLEVRRQEYRAWGKQVWNIEVEVPGTPGGTKADEILVVGAHYDSKCGSAWDGSRPAGPGTPGADDNATGVAATLALARSAAAPGLALTGGGTPARTLRFVFFVNEEPPFFQTGDMGSVVYARRCREQREKIVGVVTLDTLGYYTDAPGSQSYPFPYSLAGYPTTGNFLAFLSNVSSRRLLDQAVEAFRGHSRFPCLGAVVPSVVPRIGWSDDWSFWQEGYQAIAATDTAYLRNKTYHTVADTPEKLDYPRMALAVEGLRGSVTALSEQGA